MQSQKQKKKKISVRFQGKPFNTMVVQAYAPTNNSEEAEVEGFYEDLQDLLELTLKKDVAGSQHRRSHPWQGHAGLKGLPGPSHPWQAHEDESW